MASTSIKNTTEAAQAQIATLILTVRVHHRQRVRQRLAAEMVIEHDDIRPRRRGDRLMRQRSAIHADDEIVTFRQFPHRGWIGAVAFVNPVGNVERRAMAEVTKPGDEQRGGGAAINIVISEDGNPLPPFQTRDKALRGLCHVAEAQRIGKQIAERGGTVKRGILCRHPLPDKHPAKGQGQARGLRHGFRETVLLYPGADPAPPGRGPLDAKEGGAEEGRRLGHFTGLR